MTTRHKILLTVKSSLLHFFPLEIKLYNGKLENGHDSFEFVTATLTPLFLAKFRGADSRVGRLGENRPEAGESEEFVLGDCLQNKPVESMRASQKSSAIYYSSATLLSIAVVTGSKQSY